VKAQVLIDTGPLVAILAKSDSQHAVCVEALRTLTPPLFTCWPVVTEVAWLLRRQPLAIAKLFESFETGLLTMLSVDDGAIPEIAKLLHRYRDLGAQVADAALVHLAEREGIDTIFTMDRRDFTVYRYRDNRSFHLVP
jgi:predicted nucleic acid-binding protein